MPAGGSSHGRDGLRWWTWPVVAVGLLTAIALTLVLVATRHGPGVSPDSAIYLSGGRNLADGRGYANFQLVPIRTFPPGFSVTLAAGEKVGTGATTAARAINAAALAALVVLTFVLARRHVRLVAFAIGAAAAVAFSRAATNTSSYAWSEPVFCVLTVALVLIVESVLDRHARSPWLLAAAALVASIGFLYRYAGIVLLVFPMVVIVVAAREDGWGAAGPTDGRVPCDGGHRADPRRGPERE